MDEKKVNIEQGQQPAENAEAEAQQESINEESAPAEEPKSEAKGEKKKSDKNGKYKKELEKVKKELADSAEKCEEYRNDYLRARADYENLKRRTETSNAQFYSDGVVKAVLELLPVIDNLERALDAERENTSMRQGVEMVLRLAKTSLEKLGVEEIEALGAQFDPTLHNAVMQVAAEEGEESGIVKTVLMKGYRLGERIIRHSMVQVTE